MPNDWPCPSCGGKTYERELRHVDVNGRQVNDGTVWICPKCRVGWERDQKANATGGK